MYKAKLCGFAIACMVGLLGISPVYALAAETNTESVTLSETNKDHKGNKAAFDEKMKKASEKWDTLTAKQKSEVYALVENRMKAENKLMDKLVEYGIMEKADADKIAAHMSEKLSKLKESGEFPLLRMKDKQKQ